MKTTTIFLAEEPYFDLESYYLFNDKRESCFRLAEKSFLNLYNNMLGIKYTTVAHKYLRTKVKKGNGKGKTRVAVFTVK